MQRWELHLGDPDYPSGLLHLNDPPRALFGIGDKKLLGGGLAIVGARKATPYGLRVTQMFGGWAAAHGVVIISGAAIGCDQAAHKAAFEQGGSTVAVLACGADVNYPAGAGHLLDRIRIEGCVVSETPWGVAAQKWSFVRRNRIIAALADAVLIVEASLPSGTFTTADFALEAGRDVYAVPGSIFAPECRGCNRLIRQGAVPITEVSDLAAALGETSVLQLELPLAEDDPVLRALLADPLRPDDVAREFALEIIEAVRHIGDLEAQGLVTRYPDGRYGPP
jgi:DNA processing protein